jgi:hypothetical protein
MNGRSLEKALGVPAERPYSAYIRFLLHYRLMEARTMGCIGP